MAEELPTSTKGHFLRTFRCRVGVANEPAAGLEIRDGFLRVPVRLNQEQLEGLIDELLDLLQYVKSKG